MGTKSSGLELRGSESNFAMAAHCGRDFFTPNKDFAITKSKYPNEVRINAIISSLSAVPTLR